MRIHVLDIPLHTPFHTAGGEVAVRRTGIVELTDDGVTGWGEAAPYPGQDEPFAQVVAAAHGAGESQCLTAAIDEAASDLSARARGVPLVPLQPERLPISLAVGMIDTVETVERLVQRHVRRFKLKIAPGSLDQVAAVRSEHPEIVLGVDANASFDHGTAAELNALADLDIAYVEEPFVEWDVDLAAQLRESLRAPIFADESIGSAQDVAAMLAHPAVDGITIKAGRLGWGGAQAAADAAEVAGKLWRSSSLLETSVGRAYSNRLAARAVDVVSDVAPARSLLEGDVVGDDPAPSGFVAIPAGPGIGISPDRDLLDAYTVEVIEVAAGVSPPEGRASD